MKKNNDNLDIIKTHIEYIREAVDEIKKKQDITNGRVNRIEALLPELVKKDDCNKRHEKISTRNMNDSKKMFYLIIGGVISGIIGFLSNLILRLMG